MRVYVNNQGTAIYNADFYDAFATALGIEIDKTKVREAHDDELEELKLSVRIAKRNLGSNECAYTQQVLKKAVEALDNHKQQSEASNDR